MAEENLRQLKNRFTELADRADRQDIWTETDFLNMAEQDTLLSLRLPLSPLFFGGYEGAERRIAVFGREEQTGYSYCPDIACVCIRPAAQKFAEALTHRDLLGAVMSLGLERRATGDILVLENVGYLFCLGKMAPYIMENLTSVRHTAVRCSLCPPPEQLNAPPEPKTVFVASERLDGLLSAVYKLGRTAAKELVQAERVYVNSRLAASAGQTLSEGSIVSARGYGRFIYEGTEKTTKKGRLCVRVRIY